MNKSKNTSALSRRSGLYFMRSPQRHKTKTSWFTKLILTCFILLTIGFIFFISNITKLNYPFSYAETINQYANLNNLDPLLVAAVIREESRFQADAVSGKGACGLMQLMPATAEEMAGKMGETYTKASLMKPENNIRYGTAFLASLMKKYDGDMVLALAAYNAGGSRVDGWAAKKEGAFTIGDIQYQETRDYVRKVLESYKTYQRLYYREV